MIKSPLNHHKSPTASIGGPGGNTVYNPINSQPGNPYTNSNLGPGRYFGNNVGAGRATPTPIRNTGRPMQPLPSAPPQAITNLGPGSMPQRPAPGPQPPKSAFGGGLPGMPGRPGGLPGMPGGQPGMPGINKQPHVGEYDEFKNISYEDAMAHERWGDFETWMMDEENRRKINNWWKEMHNPSMEPRVGGPPRLPSPNRPVPTLTAKNMHKLFGKWAEWTDKQPLFGKPGKGLRPVPGKPGQFYGSPGLGSMPPGMDPGQWQQIQGITNILGQLEGIGSGTDGFLDVLKLIAGLQGGQQIGNRKVIQQPPGNAIPY